AGETVFTSRITSNQYGDGKGSASYVGTCDATNEAVAGTCDDTTRVCKDDSGIKAGASCTVAGQTTDCATNVQENRVTVNIRGIYKSAITLAADHQAYGSRLGDFDPTTGTAPYKSLDFQNPGPLVQIDTCKENGDTFFE